MVKKKINIKTKKAIKKSPIKSDTWIVSNSAQLNYMYNLEERNMSSFIRLARRVFDSSQSGVLRANIGASFIEDNAPSKKKTRKKTSKKKGIGSSKRKILKSPRKKASKE